jgi:hypothetical protein
MPYWKKEFSTEPDLSITAAQDSLIVSILSAVSRLRDIVYIEYTNVVVI